MDIYFVIIESLTPSGDLSVCPGGHLSFNCSTNLSLIEWNVTISQSGKSDIRRQLAIVTSATKLESYLIISGHMFNITRSSPPDILPLTSTLTVSNTVATTKIKCTEIGSSLAETSTSVATISIINST